MLLLFQLFGPVIFSTHVYGSFAAAGTGSILMKQTLAIAYSETPQSNWDYYGT